RRLDNDPGLDADALPGAGVDPVPQTVVPRPLGARRAAEHQVGRLHAVPQHPAAPVRARPGDQPPGALDAVEGVVGPIRGAPPGRGGGAPRDPLGVASPAGPPRPLPPPPGPPPPPPPAPPPPVLAARPGRRHPAPAARCCDRPTPDPSRRPAGGPGRRPRWSG